MFACKSAGYTLQLGLVPQDSAKAEVPFLPPNQCRLNDKSTIHQIQKKSRNFLKILIISEF